MVDINIKIPALEMLVKYTASGIGAVAGPMLAPWRAEQRAKAKRIETQGDADSLRLIADAQVDAQRSLVASSEERHAVLEIDPTGIKQRIEFQETKRQANIKAAVREAATELGDKEVPDHEPDPDWTARFFDGVQDVSSEDMRGLWAKVLSGEVEEPGRTSLRTLDILKNMTRTDAQLFVGVCDFVIDDFVYYPKEYQQNLPQLLFSKIVHLESIGLVHHSSFLHKTLTFSGSNTHVLGTYQDWLLRISTEEESKTVEIPVILLTQPGKELSQILERTLRMSYLHSFSKFFNDQKCKLSHASIVERYSNGSVRYRDDFLPIEPTP